MKWYVYKVGSMYISDFDINSGKVELSRWIERAYICPCSLSKREQDFRHLEEIVEFTGAKEYVMEEVENDV